MGDSQTKGSWTRLRGPSLASHTMEGPFQAAPSPPLPQPQPRHAEKQLRSISEQAPPSQRGPSKEVGRKGHREASCHLSLATACSNLSSSACAAALLGQPSPSVSQGLAQAPPPPGRPAGDSRPHCVLLPHNPVARHWVLTCDLESRISLPLQSILPAAIRVIFLEHKCDLVTLFL